LPFRHGELVRDAGDLVELALRAAAEERHPLQQLDFGVLSQHRSIVVRALARVKLGRYSSRMARDTDALIVDAVRSPIGKRNGTLSHIRGDDLSAQVVNGLLARHDLDPSEVEDLQWGCVTQINEQTWNIGRNVALTAGWPVSVCGTTVDRQCGSSMQTNFNVAAAIWSGQLDLVISGGVEMMSRVPMGSSNGSMSDAVTERFDIVMQGISAEEIAKKWDLSREELDRYSLESHRRATRAIEEGRFEKEIIPIELDVPTADDGGGTLAMTRTRFAVDEAVRQTTLEKMASLQPAFMPEGVITAGNSSQIVDGSAAVLVASEKKASQLGLEPRARFLGFGLAGVDPHLMLHGNPEACDKALAKAGLTWDDMAVIEVNEAFASVILQFLKDTHLGERYEAGDVNPNGGGISLGHPLGATGARITATLVSELERRNARYGIAAMCIGFGQAIAGVVERL
jgi:acetyl-CoA acyltransferase